MDLECAVEHDEQLALDEVVPTTDGVTVPMMLVFSDPQTAAASSVPRPRSRLPPPGHLAFISAANTVR
jgi:hypothetical protein